MTGFTEFLAMGGYAFYVWTSYAVASVLLLGIAVWSRNELKRARTQAFNRVRQSRERS